jgi:ankyrin repeat protein
MRILAALVLLAPALFAQPEPELRKAVNRALRPLTASAAVFVSKRACVSCHHNILPILMLHSAAQHGIRFDAAVLQAVEEKTFRELRSPSALDDAIRGAAINDPTPNDSFLLIAADAAGLEQNLPSWIYARRLMRWQQNDGHWQTSDFRPPHSSSVFTATASAVRSISLYMLPEMRAEGEAVMSRARAWLAKTQPVSTEDAAFRLMGLVWSHADPAQIESARRDLTALEKPNGGWAELPGYQSDAYSTGEALYALSLTGSKVTERGRKFLLSTQASDGTWHVGTRMLSPAAVSPKYFSSGFPYKHDEYLSYAASCWAVMALLTALPASPPDIPKPAAAAEPWIRTALFGTAQQLAALLDGALDPNSTTNNGSTLLMMSAPDAEKVRLLLSRGAKPNIDALTVAATYRGTAASINALLAAGVKLEGKSGKHSPLELASMTGDLDNVRLLLAHGADPAGAPLSQAVTFGYPDIVEALIAAGASPKITESSGINLLHWAAIANRASVIPVLVKAGVKLNAIDDFGYTPLMYAATIDVGETDALKALLAAGADRSVKNFDNRTPMEQARRYHHARIEAALK